ncbi:hypothetical protein HYT54_01470 [Candidatus Woesearchaeota archaeon]|nr:hypothetical protein [Candidatus Woesearchaeota archaeon]
MRYINITWNMSGILRHANYSVSGKTASVWNDTQLSDVVTGSVINFTVYATDTSNNVRQNSTLITVVDEIFPVVNTTFNITSPAINDVLNFSGNITDETQLLSVNITYNMTGAIVKANYSASGLAAGIHNFTTITCSGCLINFTMYATDTANNVRQNSTLIQVRDTVFPVINVTFNSTSPAFNDYINISANATDETNIRFINITYNMSGITYVNFTGGTKASSIHNVTRITVEGSSVINFTVYVTDTSNNVRQNSTLITVADRASPLVNFSFNKTVTNVFQNDTLNFTYNVSDNVLLSAAQFIINATSGNEDKIRYFNFTFSGRDASFAQNFTVECDIGCVINVTTIVNDSSGNVARNQTLITVATRNQVPVIQLSNASGFSVDPTEGGLSRILISFNVTDPDGISEINATTAIVNLTLGGSGGQFRFNISAQGGEFGTCSNHTEGSPVRVVINCTVLMKYFDNASSNWIVDARVQDINGATGTNNTHIFTYNELSAISFSRAFINFSNVNLGQNDQPAVLPLILNNTGNDDFDQLNLTAAALIGTSDATKSIAASQFTINYTNATLGAGRALGTSAVTIPGRDATANLTLRHGHASALTDYNDLITSASGNQSLYFWVDVPSSGLTIQNYNSTWNMTAVDLP